MTESVTDTVCPQQHKITDLSKFIDLGSQLGAHLFKSTFLMFMWTSTTIKLPTSNEILSVLSNDPSINSICFYSQFFLSHIYKHTYTDTHIHAYIFRQPFLNFFPFPQQCVNVMKCLWETFRRAVAFIFSFQD